MSILINLAAEFTGRKAFKDADKSVRSLDKSAAKLGRTLGVSLSTAAVVAFGKASVKAFAEDQAAATRLAKVIDNLGLGFANVQVAGFISDLEKSASVADDELRPAFQALITTTGSLTNSQKLLSNAIDISRGSGVDLATVAQDLANAYVGNTKGLKKYNIGLTQAELKAASFTEIMNKLNGQFSGASAAYLKTYAGQMEVLTVAADNAKETIGKGLISAITSIAGHEGDVNNVADSFQTMSDNISNAITGAGILIGRLKEMTGISALSSKGVDWFKVTNPIAYLLAQTAKQSASAKLAPASANMHLAELSAASNAAAQAKAEADAKKRARDLANALKAQTKALKDQATLKKAASIFDLNQIQIIAALKGKLSDEDRKRLELQMALETENVTEAQRLTLEIAKSQGLTDALAKTLASLPAAQNPFAAWKGYLDEVELQAKRIASMSVSATPSASIPTNAVPIPNFELPPSGTYGTPNGPVQGPVVVKVELDGKQIQESVQNQNNQGNGAYFPRLGSSMYAV